MNTYTLESFISFCDDMQIAEEGAIHQMNSYSKLLAKKVGLLKIKLKKNDGNYKEQAAAIDDTVETLDRVRSNIEKMNVSDFRKGVGKVEGVLSKILLVIGIISTLTVFGAPIGVPSIIAGVSLSTDADNTTDKKDEILRQIDKARDHLLEIKKVLKKNSVTQEGFMELHQEKKTLKNEMKKAGYGAFSKSRFKKDLKESNKYIDTSYVSSIVKERKSDIDTLRKIGDDMVNQMNKCLQKTDHPEARASLIDYSTVEYYRTSTMKNLSESNFSNRLKIGFYVDITDPTNDVFCDGYTEDELYAIAYKIKKKNIKAAIYISHNNDEYVTVEFLLKV